MLLFIERMGQSGTGLVMINPPERPPDHIRAGAVRYGRVDNYREYENNLKIHYIC